MTSTIINAQYHLDPGQQCVVAPGGGSWQDQSRFIASQLSHYPGFQIIYDWGQGSELPTVYAHVSPADTMRLLGDDLE
jgi:hypothetical protein